MTLLIKCLAACQDFPGSFVLADHAPRGLNGIRTNVLSPAVWLWHNFWDTRLTYQKSYLARSEYVHQNAVKHGPAPVANQYRWLFSEMV